MLNCRLISLRIKAAPRRMEESTVGWLLLLPPVVVVLLWLWLLRVGVPFLLGLWLLVVPREERVAVVAVAEPRKGDERGMVDGLMD